MATIYWRPEAAMMRPGDVRGTTQITLGLYEDAGYTTRCAERPGGVLIYAEPSSSNQALLDMARAECQKVIEERAAATAASGLVSRVMAYPGRAEVFP